MVAIKPSARADIPSRQDRDSWIYSQCRPLQQFMGRQFQRYNRIYWKRATASGSLDNGLDEGEKAGQQGAGERLSPEDRLALSAGAGLPNQLVTYFNGLEDGTDNGPWSSDLGQLTVLPRVQQFSAYTINWSYSPTNKYAEFGNYVKASQDRMARKQEHKDLLRMTQTLCKQNKHKAAMGSPGMHDLRPLLEALVDSITGWNYSTSNAPEAAVSPSGDGNGDFQAMFGCWIDGLPKEKCKRNLLNSSLQARWDSVSLVLAFMDLMWNISTRFWAERDVVAGNELGSYLSALHL